MGKEKETATAEPPFLNPLIAIQLGHCSKLNRKMLFVGFGTATKHQVTVVAKLPARPFSCGTVDINFGSSFVFPSAIDCCFAKRAKLVEVPGGTSTP